MLEKKEYTGVLWAEEVGNSRWMERKPGARRGHEKELRFHCKCFGKPLEEFNQGSNRIRKASF